MRYIEVITFHTTRQDNSYQVLSGWEGISVLLHPAEAGS